MLSHNAGILVKRNTPVTLTPASVLLDAPFQWWVVCSLVACILAIPFDLLAFGRRRRNASNVTRQEFPAKEQATAPPILDEPNAQGRRAFLERTAGVVTASPFVAGTYGLFYGRLNLETTVQRIKLALLPKAMDGFRIAQLSDIHIGPFMPGEEIRRYVAIANALKPDLIVLTGDFVTFDPNTQRAVVDALSGLRAPFGVYGCLGNHDAWAGVQSSITELFRSAGVRIRQERVAIGPANDSFNLVGVDFQSPRAFGPSKAVARLLGNIEHGLLLPDHVNILLSHNPDTFDRAAEMGIDLSLAGHTHGGQVALEFIDPEIAPSRLVTPYVSGLFQKPGGQLYVNRGIGTIGVPIRIGAPPEITVFELKRA
jgi:predicted MPP superfamily phosphohydrolase